MSDPSQPPDPIELPELSGERREVLIGALGDWADRHPAPDRPFLGFTDEKTFLSPRDLVSAVSRNTDTGERFVRMVRYALTEMSFDAYIESIRASARKRRGSLLRGIWKRILRIWFRLRRVALPR